MKIRAVPNLKEIVKVSSCFRLNLKTKGTKRSALSWSRFTYNYQRLDVQEVSVLLQNIGLALHTLVIP